MSRDQIGSYSLLPELLAEMAARFPMCLVLSFCLFGFAASVHVRESHLNTLFINVAVPQETIRELVHPLLTPVPMPDGKFYLTIEGFQLEKLEMSTPFGWWNMGSQGYLFKLKTCVSQNGGEHQGQLIFDMDFPSGLSGYMQTFGCSHTFSGTMKCHHDASLSTTFSSTSGEIILSTEDKQHLLGSFAVGLLR